MGFIIYYNLGLKSRTDYSSVMTLLPSSVLGSYLSRERQAKGGRKAEKLELGTETAVGIPPTKLRVSPSARSS